MHVTTQLISTPMASPSYPSIQLSCLEKYLTESGISKDTIHCHSLFLQIALRYGLRESFANLIRSKESPYRYLYALDFPDEFGVSATQLNGAKSHKNSSEIEFHGHNVDIKRLREVTLDCVDQRVVPLLKKNEINLIGFSLNFDQIYASLYVMRTLMKYQQEYNIIFALGGGSVGNIKLTEILRDLKIPAWLFIGEGEIKLADFHKQLTLIKEKENLHEECLKLHDEVNGVFFSLSEYSLLQRKPSWFKNQLHDLKKLGTPNFDEFFQTLELEIKNQIKRKIFVNTHVSIPIEGSRGCVLSCEFCNLNYNWEGYRKRELGDIIENMEHYQKIYGIKKFRFLDNLCDPWLQQIHSSQSLTFNAEVFMEIRPKHSFEMWKKLKDFGVNEIQIGLEAFSPKLLQKIGKRTTLMDNLKAVKYNKELGVTTASNILTHYPRSDTQDIEITKKYLALTHMRAEIVLNPFGLRLGSPAFEALSSEEKESIDFETAQKGQSKIYSVSANFKFPKSISLDEQVEKDWVKLYKWYEEEEKTKSDITIIDDTNGVVSVKLADDSIKKYVGHEASIINLCHDPYSKKDISTKLNISTEELNDPLKGLLADNVIICADELYLSWPLRNLDKEAIEQTA